MILVAHNITNLTDARYFAARGARMIGFHTEYSTIEEVNAIKGWIDVPEFYLHLTDDIQAEELWEWSHKTGISRYLIRNKNEELESKFTEAQWMHFFNDNNRNEDLLFVDKKSEQNLVEIINYFYNSATNIMVDYGAIHGQLDEIANQINGIFITGSKEEEIGLKSFDDIDDFLDKVDIEY